MRAIILAGGEAVRMRPLSRQTPKELMPVLCRPLIEHLLSHLRLHGVREVTLAMAPRKQAIRDALGDGSHLGVRIACSYEEQPLGSGGAVAKAAQGWREPFFVLNGDILTDLDLTAMAAAHRQHRAELSIALREVEDTTGFGVVTVDTEDRITRFVEKPAPGTAPSRLANAGVWLFEPSLVDEMDGGRFHRLEDGIFPQMAASGRGIYGYRFYGDWSDVGTPEALLRVNMERCRGEAVTGDGVTVGPGASILAPAVIGPQSQIGEGAVVSESLLWDGVHVGEGAVVRDSILASGVTIGARAYVEGSVVAHGARVAAGARLMEATVEPESGPTTDIEQAAAR